MSKQTRLLLASFLMLFAELALIRWAGSYVVYLSYFSNFVLLGSFLGIGVGFLRARSPRSTFAWAPVVFAFLVIFLRIFSVEIDRTGGDLIYFGGFGARGLPTWVMLPLIFMAAAAAMALIAEEVGRVFAQFDPLDAYRLDIAGSIAGVVAFSVLSVLRAPPIGWALVVVLVFALLLRPSLRAVQVVALLALAFVATRESLDPRNSWSPYYRVTMAVRASAASGTSIDIFVNGIPHQTVTAVASRTRSEPFYLLPYERTSGNPLREVLVVGAGNGTDVAIALSKGAKHIDAVEIDPRLYEIGRDIHPDRPYDDPRVDVHIEDGRAFLERSNKHYDMILFALPDSLTLVSGQSSLRLESYLFTEEAMRAARERLRPSGAFSMYNYYREDWLVQRLAGTLAKVYGHPSCVDRIGRQGGLALMTVSPDAGAIQCPTPPVSLSGAPPPATDDYPFLYLRERSFPRLYWLTLGLILAASIVSVRVVGGPFSRMRPFADLFFMGTAFLLLETKNVVQFALLFGTTWFVNALVFTGILLSVYAAIELARHVRLPRPVILYGLLLVSVAVAYLVPQHRLLELGSIPRFLAATALAFAPVFIANLVFAQRFADVGSSTTAFATNLLGAMVGGVLEYSALVIGYRALLIVVAALYGLAFLARPRVAQV